jgi:hypothetical protein
VARERKNYHFPDAGCAQLGVNLNFLSHLIAIAAGAFAAAGFETKRAVTE